MFGSFCTRNDERYTPPEIYCEFAKLLPHEFQKIADPFPAPDAINSFKYHNRTRTLIETNSTFPNNLFGKEYDCIITNPSWKKKWLTLRWLKQNKKPFALLLPMSVLTRKYFVSLFDLKNIQIVTLPATTKFLTIQDGNISQFAKPFPYSLCFVCWKMQLNKQYTHLHY